jgi:hypothetical protein
MLNFIYAIFQRIQTLRTPHYPFAMFLFPGVVTTEKQKQSESGNGSDPQPIHYKPDTKNHLHFPPSPCSCRVDPPLSRPLFSFSAHSYKHSISMALADPKSHSPTRIRTRIPRIQAGFILPSSPPPPLSCLHLWSPSLSFPQFPS